MNETNQDNPIAVGFQLLVAGVEALAQEAAMGELWRHVAECYFLGEQDAERLYRQALRIAEGQDSGQE